MGVMDDIINEAKTLEAEATLSKEDAQTSHETMGKDKNTSLDEKTKDLINKNEMLDKTQIELTEATVQRQETPAVLEATAAVVTRAAAGTRPAMRTARTITAAKPPRVADAAPRPTLLGPSRPRRRCRRKLGKVSGCSGATTGWTT